MDLDPHGFGLDSAGFTLDSPRIRFGATMDSLEERW
jgi:hypothetical protein